MPGGSVVSCRKHPGNLMRRSSVVVLLLLSAGAFAEEPADLSGVWIGAYEYGSEADRQKVEFSVVIEQKHQVVLGRLIERQTFGGEDAVGLSATVSGVVSGSHAALVKTYDGSGGQSHSVAYELAFDPLHGTLTGTWSIEKDWVGKAVMRRITAADVERMAAAPAGNR